MRVFLAIATTVLIGWLAVVTVVALFIIQHIFAVAVAAVAVVALATLRHRRPRPRRAVVPAAGGGAAPRSLAGVQHRSLAAPPQEWR